MSNLAIISIILGAIILAVRVPFIIAPEKTVKAYRYLFAANTRTRIFGITGIILWALAIYYSHTANVPQANIIFILGIIAGMGALIFLLIFTTGYRNWVNDLMNSMPKNKGILRVLSFVPAAIGVWLIYLGIVVF